VTVINATTQANSVTHPERSRVLTIEDQGDGVLRLIGEIDMATASALQSHLDHTSAVTVLDLREVTFIDSCGLTVLMRANRERPTGEPLTLRSPNGSVWRVLEITGLIDVFRIDP
jgi:anti-anti-sigma factor